MLRIFLLFSFLAVRLLAQTDARIASIELRLTAEPDNARWLKQLAAAYIQKTRETTDFGYLDRAAKLIEKVLAVSSRDVEAMRL